MIRNQIGFLAYTKTRITAELPVVRSLPHSRHGGVSFYAVTVDVSETVSWMFTNPTRQTGLFRCRAQGVLTTSGVHAVSVLQQRALTRPERTWTLACYHEKKKRLQI